MKIRNPLLRTNPGMDLCGEKRLTTLSYKLPRGQKCPHQYLPLPTAIATGPTMQMMAITPTSGTKYATTRYKNKIQNI